MSLTARDKKIVMIMVPLALVLAYWFLLLTPKREAASVAAATLQTEKAALSDAQARATTVRAAKVTFARDYAAVVALGKAIPTSVDMPSLLVQLEEAAQGTGIELDGITMGERTPAETGVAAPTPAPGTAPSGEPPQSAPGQAAADAQAAADTASTPPPTADGAATAPADPAAAGAESSAPAAGGLEAVSMEFKFEGDFFELANFFHRLKRFVYVEGEKVRVRGRLMTIDGVEYTAEPETFPALVATVKATVYLTSKAQGVTAGATPSGPAAPATSPPTSTASSESPAATPPPTATATP
jgi:hypothetical protein